MFLLVTLLAWPAQIIQYIIDIFSIFFTFWN